MARVAKELRLEGRQVIQSNTHSARLGNAHMGSGRVRSSACLPHGVSTISCLGAARNSSQIDDRTPLVHELPSHHPFHPPKISKVSH
ncbi:hypothetical protein J3E68DRAFT_412474 [Trichoderma sp. SZMC 28012]